MSTRTVRHLAFCRSGGSSGLIAERGMKRNRISTKVTNLTVSSNDAGRKTRRMKVGESSYPQLTSNFNPYAGDRIIPSIRLRGQWLERAGFTVDQRLTVRVYRKRLVICIE
jgi:toxic protein SymE